MKIIKEGIIQEKIVKFWCKHCGCVFEANKNEYKSGIDRNETYCSCVCPTCKELVYIWGSIPNYLER